VETWSLVAWSYLKACNGKGRKNGFKKFAGNEQVLSLNG
jgi:hypothetical protein